MTNVFEQFIQKIKSIRLGDQKKQEGRAALLSYIKEHPISPRVPEERFSQEKLSLIAMITRLFSPKFAPSAVAVALLIIFFMGTSFAAEGSLPGDLLYPVKINITENIQSLLTFSPASKADLNKEKVERRLQELQSLALKEKLSIKAIADAEKRLEGHIKDFNSSVSEVKESGNLQESLKAYSNLEVVLKAHGEILDRIQKEKPAIQNKLTDFSGAIKDQLKNTSKERNEIEEELKESGQSESAAEGKLWAAENKIKEVKEFFSKKETELSSKNIAEVGDKLKAAEKLILEGKVKMEAGDFSAAFSLFQEAHILAQEAKLLVQAKIILKPDLKIDDKDLMGKLKSGREDEAE